MSDVSYNNVLTDEDGNQLNVVYKIKRDEFNTPI